MGLEHIRNIALLRDTCAVVAVADADANARAEARLALDAAGFPGAEVHESWRSLLASADVDAVIICLPNFQHVEILRVLLPMDKHDVLCEKPLCTTAADCLEVEAMLRARKSQKLFMVGMEYRWMPPIAKLIETVDSGSLGSTRMVTVREHRFPFLQKVGHWNRFNKFTGGTLVEKACHFFDLMRRLANDDPVSVYAAGGGGVNHSGEEYADGNVDILDFALCVVTFASGVVASLDLCMFAEDEQTERVSVVGDRGKAAAKCPEATVRVLHRNSLAPGRQPPLDEDRAKAVVHHVPVAAALKAAGYHEGATFFELEAFVKAAMQPGAQPPVSARDGTLAVAMGQAAHLSLSEKRVVLVSEVLPGLLPPVRRN